MTTTPGHKSLTKDEIAKTLTALNANAAFDHSILMDKANTSFLGSTDAEVPSEVSDDNTLVDRVKSVPVHY